MKTEIAFSALRRIFRLPDLKDPPGNAAKQDLAGKEVCPVRQDPPEQPVRQAQPDLKDP
jgi:hypothetical protein